MKATVAASLALTALFPILLLGQDTSAARDWPEFRGPTHDNKSTETGLMQEWPEGGPALVWNSKIVNGGKNIGTGYASISISKGHIYTMGDHGTDGFVYCLDEQTGKQIWSTRVGVGNAKDSYPGPRCTPAIDGDRIYALTRKGILTCLSAAKGDVIWKKDYLQDFGGKPMSGWDFSESPVIDGDKLICTPGGDDAAIVALNKVTGDLLWKSKIPTPGGAGYSSITIDEIGGIRQYITFFKNGLAAVDAKDGRFLWNYAKIANKTANIPNPVVMGDYLFASSGYGKGSVLLQLTPDDAGVKAKEIYFLPGKTFANHHGGVVVLGDYLYGCHGDNKGDPYCIEWKTGKIMWKKLRGEHPGDNSASLIYADGRLYFRYVDGTILLVEPSPKDFIIKGQFQLPHDAEYVGRSYPVILNGRIYFRGDDRLLCYDIRAKAT